MSRYMWFLILDALVFVHKTRKRLKKRRKSRGR